MFSFLVLEIFVESDTFTRYNITGSPFLRNVERTTICAGTYPEFRKSGQGGRGARRHQTRDGLKSADDADGGCYVTKYSHSRANGWSDH